MLSDTGSNSAQIPRRSCVACRKRHLKCQPFPRNQSGACVWCYEHGVDCYDSENEVKPRGDTIYTPNDGSIMLDGSTSAYGGFQLSNLSFISDDDPDMADLLHLRQAMQNKSTTAEPDEDSDTELKLDKAVERHLNDLYYDQVHPYIPIVPRAYFDSVAHSQLLLSAMYGVASRLPEAIISSRDFRHIKRVLQNELASLFVHYEPSLQACQALTLIHLTLELQCNGIEDVEAWPLRLSQGIRMALELKLHHQKSYTNDTPLLQEVKRRTFWALFTKDKWTSTGKGYPLMIYSSDVSIPLPDPTDLDNTGGPPHEFFIELIHQARVLEHIIPVCFRADRFHNVTEVQLRAVENEITQLGRRLEQSYLSAVTRSHLTLYFVAIKLLFYSPFFRPSFPSEANLFSRFIPSLNSLRITLAREAVSTILQHATVKLLFSGPSIWSILFYANLRCFLVALSIRHDYVDSYSQELREDANKAIDRVENLAKIMCQDKKWCFMGMSGNLVLWSKRIAELKTAAESWKAKIKEQQLLLQPQQQQDVPAYQVRCSNYEYSRGQQPARGDSIESLQMPSQYSPAPLSSAPTTKYLPRVHSQQCHSVQPLYTSSALASLSSRPALDTTSSVFNTQSGISPPNLQPSRISLALPSAAPMSNISSNTNTASGDSQAGLILPNEEWEGIGNGWDLGAGFTTMMNNSPFGIFGSEIKRASTEKLEFLGGYWEGMFSGFA
ncbi:fungal-specific transcription factor domain-containing protein [Lipomyces kononenkoae]